MDSYRSSLRNFGEKVCRRTNFGSTDDSDGDSNSASRGSCATYDDWAAGEVKMMPILSIKKGCFTSWIGYLN